MKNALNVQNVSFLKIGRMLYLEFGNFNSKVMFIGEGPRC